MSENKIYSDFVNFFLLLNSSILLIPNKFKAYPILFLLVFSFILYKKSKKKNNYSFKKIFLISALFFIYLASSLYSLQAKEAVFKLSTMASLVAYPIIFGFLESSHFMISKKQRETIFKGFAFSTTIFCVISFIYFWKQEFNFNETIIHYFNLIDIRLGIFSIHPIYLAIYIGISILMIIYLIQNSHYLFLKITYVFLGLLLIVILIMLMRKGPIIYLLIPFYLLLANYVKIKKTIIIVLVTLIAIIFSVKIIPKYQNENRFEELTSNTINENPESSISIRYRIYQCVFEKIIEHPFLGYGLGSVKNHLDLCYIDKNIDLSKKNYNSHNQFLSVVLTAGIIGLIIFLISIYKIYRLLLQRKSVLGIAILTFFLFNFLTENVIEREHGVIIYSFLLSFFLFQKEESYKPL